MMSHPSGSSLFANLSTSVSGAYGIRKCIVKKNNKTNNDVN